MKVIFLDFDGVIVTRRTHYFFFDRDCCARLMKIVESTGAKIVVTSTWRKHHKTLDSLKNTVARGYERPFWEHIPEGIPVGTIDPELVVGVTTVVDDNDPGDGQVWGRGKEIDIWLASHDVEGYVVLDDDTADLKTHAHKQVKSDTDKGLQDSDIEKAIGFLNGSAQQ